MTITVGSIGIYPSRTECREFRFLPDTQGPFAKSQLFFMTKRTGLSLSPPNKRQGVHAPASSPKNPPRSLTPTLFSTLWLDPLREGLHHHVIWTNPQENITTINQGEAHSVAGSGDKLGTQKSYGHAPNFVSRCLTATRDADSQAVWASSLLLGKQKLSPGTWTV